VIEHLVEGHVYVGCDPLRPARAFQSRGEKVGREFELPSLLAVFGRKGVGSKRGECRVRRYNNRPADSRFP
jgi:hypothetical protein